VTGEPTGLIRVARVGSTMDALHELAQAGAAAGTAVVAEEQGAGRGSRGRAWSSPPGGLWLSVLARPASTGLEVLSLRAGLAVAVLLDRLGAAGRVELKWPNDLMLDDRKVGGILCEARWQGGTLAWVAVGLGLNVTNAPPPELAATATHLASVLPSLTPAGLAQPARTGKVMPSRFESSSSSPSTLPLRSKPSRKVLEPPMIAASSKVCSKTTK